MLVGLRTDEANTKRKGKPLFWQVCLASALQGDTFKHGGFLRRHENILGRTVWAILVGTLL